ncbi:MAG: hypothetical protein GY805_08365, partial [Chloroflexi bacterium]|nr:hypothetical protein [Chloroflexota bacterium]
MLQKLKSLSRWKKAAVAVFVLTLTAVPTTLITRNLWLNRPFPDVPETSDIQLVTPSDPISQLTSSSAGLEAFGGGQTAVLRINLSEGEDLLDEIVTNPVVAGDPLTDDEIQAVLDRLPPFTAVSSDVESFRLPDELIPPPRPGETITESFPPPPTDVAVPTVDDSPLTVLRYSPEGEIPLAPFLNVTFSQPMVPLTSLESLSEADVPVNLTPAIPGTWRWVSPETLSFSYESDVVDRFPKATEFVAEIPAGTQSATGGVLAEAVTWTFSTPPPVVESFYPQNGSQPLEPIMFVSFDQLIDPAAVLSTIQVQAGSQTVSLRQATEAEIEADATVSRMVQNSAEGRWLAFRAERPFATDTPISISIGPGTPSAEGPRTTESAQTFSFSTYPPLEISEHRCGWSDDCPPLTPFFIYFNNPIDFTAVDETMFQIDPELPGAVVDIQGNLITISGNTNGQTTYRVLVNGRIQDIFGQTLGNDQILSFSVGKANPFMSGADQPMITLDPSAAAPFYTVYSININRIKVRAYAVEPTDWPAFGNFWQEFDPEDNPILPPGQEVMDKTISVDGTDDQLTETTIDLSDALDGEFGHLIVILEPVSFGLDDYERRRFTLKNWVQVTNIGVDAIVDNGEMVVWATALANGAPLSGVTVRLEPTGTEVATGGDGTIRFDMPIGESKMLTAQLGEDTAVLPSNPYPWGGYSWQSYAQPDYLRWYVFDDRSMYRPGEEVHLKGWIRNLQNQPDGDIGLLDGVETVFFRLTGPQGNEILDGLADVNALGGFDFSFTLPDNTNLGYANLELQASGVSGNVDNYWHNHGIQIQEFRRPEFEVSARNESSGPYFLDGEATVAVAANYFAGGALPNAEVTWSVSSTPSSYTPPNWRGFTFGKWTPWWIIVSYDYVHDYEYEFGYGYEEGSYETFSGVTDASGNHYLNLDFEEAEGLRPFSVIAEATVMDVNRQAWTSSTSLLVHPSDLYVGLRSERTFVRRGTPLDIELIVTDLDGNPVAGQEIQVQAARLEWRRGSSGWNEEAVETQDCTIASADEPVTCTFATSEGGSYRITATVTDAQERANQSEFTRWVSGGRRPSSRDIEQETVTLIPDKETYQPGDVAEILVQAPFAPAEGLLTVSRSGILYTEQFQLADGSATLQIPIEDGHIPNLHVQVDLVGETARTNADGEAIADVPSRPAFAVGYLNLSIPPHSRTLTLEATPQDAALEPGGETTLDVQVVDANGQPVADAELAVVIVDEAILALSNYQLTDPSAIFYGERPSAVSGYYGRSNILLANPASLIGQVEGSNKNFQEVEVTRVVTSDVVTEGEMVEEEAMEMAFAADDAAAAPPPEGTPIQIRTNFDPLATFAPAVHTDSQGYAQVEVQLPDNLTRYRIMVVAVAGGKQFGTVEANLTARLPLMVRPSAPRFLNFGDQFELPVLLQNQTDEPMQVNVVAEVTNIELTEGSGLHVTIPANDRVEVRFPATTVSAGTARVRITATSGQHADSTSLEFPVYTPATTEAFAIYGTLDEGAVAQPVAFPDDVYTQFGGLEIHTSSTALQSLTDAVLYISSHRYDSTEQLASRILAIASLRDVLSAFEAEGLPTPEEMETAVQRDIETLQGLQNYDGGFPIWRRGRDSYPYFSIYTTHALVQAEAKGFDVPQQMLSNALSHLQDIESYYPSYYSERTRQTLSAYALYVRHLAGNSDTAKAQNLYNGANLDELSLEAAAWLWHVLPDSPTAAEIARH